MIIPARWNEVLQSLHEGGFPEAIIAGGALRDLDNARPIKDVDIFVAGKGGVENELALLNKAFGYVGVSIFDLDEIIRKEEYPDWNEGVCGVYNFKHSPVTPRLPTLPGPEFQVIVMGDAASRTIALKNEQFFGRHVVDSFDIAFCQIWHSNVPGDFGRIPLYTMAYGQDYVRKNLTVIRAPNEAQLARTKKRIERLLIKYPDYTPQCVHVSEEPVVPASMEKEPF